MNGTPGPTSVGVTGATGRMGRAVLRELDGRPEVTSGFAVSRDPGETAVAGVDVEPAVSFETLLEDRTPDAVVDFTAPEATTAYAAACGRLDVPFVTGTTGLDDDGWAKLADAAESTPICHAPNFGRGVGALVEVVAGAVERLPEYDVEVIERHHNRKRDAPSGTANRLVEAIEATGSYAGRTHGREGEQSRAEGEIGVHAIRAGDLTGEHEVVLAGNHEELRLVHRAEDRGVFAAGAVDAAVWLADRTPGVYDFSDVSGGQRPNPSEDT